MGLESEEVKSKALKKLHQSSISKLVFYNKNNTLLSGDKGGIIKISSISGNSEIKEKGQLALPNCDGIRDISATTNIDKIVIGCDDKSLKIIDYINFQVENNLQGHGNDVLAVSWHPTHSLIASGGKDRITKFWDPSSGKCILSTFNHTNTINKISFNKEGILMASAGKDQIIRIFDIRTFKEIYNLNGHQGEILDFSWHSVLRHTIISCDSEAKVNCWKLPLTTPTFSKSHKQNSIMIRSCFDETSNWAYSVSNDKKLKKWELINII